MSEPAILLERLSKSYGDTDAVCDLSLTIVPGTIFGFLGANGAGKTTTIRMLCGLVHPTSGRAEIAGMDVWRERHQARAQFGYVAQRFSLYRDLTVEENIRFFAGASRVPRNEIPERLERLLKLTDLEKKRHAMAGGIFRGLRPKLGVSFAPLRHPPPFFLLEPTSGLDPVHRQQIWDLLYDLSHRGITIFVTTHYMDEAERCTEVGFIEEGRLLAKAAPRGLKESFQAKLLEIDVDPIMPALVKLREVPGILGVSLRSGSLRLYAIDAEKLVNEWQRDWPFADLKWRGHRWVEPDMEDVFTAYSQGYDALLKPR